jgi:hypothetical protein
MTQSVSPFPWPGFPLTTMAIGIALLAAPASIEGPILLPISPGHALSVLDSVALVPMLAGTWFLYAGLWRRRAGLRRLAHDAPGPTGAAVFVGGFGLGLLIASAFSAFFWWWAIGAVLFGALLLAAALAVSGRSGNGASRP